MSAPRASIIVLTYNLLKQCTKPCVESIFKNTPEREFELVIVDNASTDGTPDYLRELAGKHYNVQIVLNQENRGFPGGNNDGLKVATGHNLILLNNDTLVPPGWLNALLTPLEKDKNIGLIGPISNSVGNEQRVNIKGMSESNYEKLAEAYVNRNKGVAFSPAKLGFFCVAMRHDVFSRVGFLDENFGIGMFEDDDYCLRVLNCGYKLMAREDCFIYHKGSFSFKKLSADTYLDIFKKNQRYLFEKHHIQWTFSDIALSYVDKFMADLEAYEAETEDPHPAVERISHRLENFRHLIIQTREQEMKTWSTPASYASSKSAVRAQWALRRQIFRDEVIKGNWPRRKNYFCGIARQINMPLGLAIEAAFSAVERRVASLTARLRFRKIKPVPITSDTKMDIIVLLDAPLSEQAMHLMDTLCSRTPRELSRIKVVLPASSEADGPLPMLKGDDQVELLFVPDDATYAERVNSALGRTFFGHTVIIRNATEVTHGWFQHLLAPLNQFACIGMISPVPHEGNTSEQVQFTRLTAPNPDFFAVHNYVRKKLGPLDPVYESPELAVFDFHTRQQEDPLVSMGTSRPQVILPTQHDRQPSRQERYYFYLKHGEECPRTMREDTELEFTGLSEEDHSQEMLALHAYLDNRLSRKEGHRIKRKIESYKKNRLANSTVNKDHQIALNKILTPEMITLMCRLHMADQGKIVIMPPTVDFAFMLQRPQHLALALAEAGYLVLYATFNHNTDRVRTIQEVNDNLYILNLSFLLNLPHVLQQLEMIYYCIWPVNAKYIPFFSPKTIIYDYLDDLSLLEANDKETRIQHREIIEKADLITVSADTLHRQIPNQFLGKTILLPNAVDQGFIEQCLAGAPVPDQLRSLKDAPVVGYYGAIAPWMDCDLVRFAATQMPDVHFVFIGPIFEIEDEFKQLVAGHSNIHHLGQMDRDRLVPFLLRFDCCMIPFIKNEITDAVSPVKLFEYFAAGKPVITTDLTECCKYEQIVIAKSGDEFVDAIRKALKSTPKQQDTIRQLARENTWGTRIQQVLHALGN